MIKENKINLAKLAVFSLALIFLSVPGFGTAFAEQNSSKPFFFW